MHSYLEESDGEEAPLRDALGRLESLPGPENVPDVHCGALLRVPQPNLLPPAGTILVYISKLFNLIRYLNTILI